MKASPKIFMLATATLLLACADLLTGGTGLTGLDADIFLKLRLPRMLTAVLAGACLSLAGLQMQSVFRNPLADPHIMGVSAGAGTGAAMATLLIGTSLPAALSGLTVATAAFLGALLTSMLVVTVASKFQSTTTLLIFGVMLGFIFSALTSIQRREPESILQLVGGKFLREPAGRSGGHRKCTPHRSDAYLY